VSFNGPTDVTPQTAIKFAYALCDVLACDPRSTAVRALSPAAPAELYSQLFDVVFYSELPATEQMYRNKLSLLLRTASGSLGAALQGVSANVSNVAAYLGAPPPVPEYRCDCVEPYSSAYNCFYLRPAWIPPAPPPKPPSPSPPKPPSPPMSAHVYLNSTFVLGGYTADTFGPGAQRAFCNVVANQLSASSCVVTSFSRINQQQPARLEVAFVLGAVWGQQANITQMLQPSGPLACAGQSCGLLWLQTLPHAAFVAPSGGVSYSGEMDEGAPPASTKYKWTLILTLSAAAGGVALLVVAAMVTVALMRRRSARGEASAAAAENRAAPRKRDVKL
jgi:hypothetical protein